MTTKEIIHFYDKHADSFDTKIASLDLYHQSYKSFVKEAPKKTSLLDLACGPGNIATFIQQFYPGIKITGVDLSKEMLKIAKSRLPAGEFYESDILNIAMPQRQYDLIICGFGLPYIKGEDVSVFAEQVARFTHAESRVYISCMQGTLSQLEEVSFGDEEKLLIHYHTKDTVMNAFVNCEFQLVSYQEQDYPEEDGTISTDMLFVFEKN